MFCDHIRVGGNEYFIIKKLLQRVTPFGYPLFCRHGINSTMIKIKRQLSQQVKQYAFNKRESGNFKEV